MYSVVETEEFTQWLLGLKDRVTRARLQMRLRKASLGNLGDVRAVGESVFEMREFFGPGWRMYYVERAGTLILMLGGGDKSSQARDIELAHNLLKEINHAENQNPSV